MTLIERLKKRAAEDAVCAANNEAVASALDGQMALFEAGKGEHNIYAVRMAVDHRNCAKRDRQWSADLLEAIEMLGAKA
jgi:hypothetical protein